MVISKLFVWDNSKSEIMQKMFIALTKLAIGQISVGHSSFIAGFLQNSDVISILWQQPFPI